MSDDALTRIRAILAITGDARSRSSFSRVFEAALKSDPSRHEILRGYEQDLAELDEAASEALKTGAARRLTRTKKNGWGPLFDALNEVKGYKHLKQLGCCDIAFIAPSYAQKSPDLAGDLNGARVLCEVKTIHISEGELPEQFFSEKVTNIIVKAKAQLDAFDITARKVVYLVFHSDDADHGKHVAAFLRSPPVDGVEIEFVLNPNVPH
jgi:hypothetical protein